MKKMLIALAATAVLGMGIAVAESNCIGEAAVAGIAGAAITGGNIGAGLVAAGATYLGCEIKSGSDSSNPYPHIDDTSGWEE